MAQPTGRVEGWMTAFAFLGNARIDLAHTSPDADGVEITAQVIAGAVDLLGSVTIHRAEAKADG